MVVLIKVLLILLPTIQSLPSVVCPKTLDYTEGQYTCSSAYLLQMAPRLRNMARGGVIAEDYANCLTQ
jgi:hypothetical protein